ncbi:MAG TPA: SDR family NAD(P)-dependent oxidoreductase, partial [Acidimicrobiales bacterium]|nr:SDR family NAD(P)-dependent oxidoreductase [Acidimicrobiales bacterium]
MDLGVRGRTFVVFGGTRGIGLAAAHALASDGAAVAVVGRDPIRAAEAATTLGELDDGPAIGLTAELREAGEAERVFDEVRGRLGEVRGVAITTGLGGRGQRSLLDATDDDWEDTFSDVLLGTVRACRAAVPRLVDAGGGAIVTTAAYSIRAPKPFQ